MEAVVTIKMKPRELELTRIAVEHFRLHYLTQAKDGLLTAKERQDATRLAAEAELLLKGLR